MNTRVLSTLVLLACSCTDGPGGMPHASSDTTAPATGSTSREPTTTAPSTGADTTAPATGADTTAGPSTGLPTGSTGLTTGDPSGGPAMVGVYARYEVRDNTGTPVEIWASPSCSPGTDCYPTDFGPFAPDCMAVQAVGQDVISLSYTLDTAEPEPCYVPFASWDDVGTYYFDPGCTDRALITGQIFLVGGVLYHGARADASIPPFWYSGTPAACNAIPNTSFRFSPPSLVPAEILGLLEDGAPYEIAIAY